MEILYHYCSTATFHSIVDTRSVRLSSLSLSNDTLEGKLVANAVAQLAKRDDLSQATSLRLQDYLNFFEKIFDGLGFCLSEDGDVLSQWRGYAADATGVAIGFSRAYLEWLSMMLLMLFPKLYLLKSPAFREEREWRLLSHSLLRGDEVLSYRPLPDRLAPFRAYELLEMQRQPIVEVVLGPKHLTPATVIEGFLKQCGFGTVSVKRSGASYR